MEKEFTEKEVIILTKSAKHGGYCVVCFDLEDKKLIRLVSSIEAVQNSILDRHLKCTDNSYADILDVVKIHIKPQPKEIHKENWLIKENYKLKKIRRLDIQAITKYLNFENDFIFENVDYYLDYATAKNQSSSILLTLVNDIYLKNNFGKTKINFIYNNKKFSDFAVTDSDYFGLQYCKHFKSAIIVFSIPDSSDKWCIDNNKFYKFAAKIFPIKIKKDNE